MPGREPVRWTPGEDDPSLYRDCVYYGRVFRAMEDALDRLDAAEPLTVYLTEDLERLPRYGDDVVAVVIADSWARLPAYTRRVRAVFKCHGTVPTLQSRPLRYPNRKSVLDVVRLLVALVRWAPGATRVLADRLRRPGTGATRVFDVPLGYYNATVLPPTPVGDRPYDVGFFGSVVDTAHARTSLKYWVGNVKTASRRRMLRAVEELRARRPDLALDIRFTRDFADSARQREATYAEHLQSVRLCLVPRGNAPETFRLVEALRAGCVVVTEPLPPRWFYRDAPLVVVEDWAELPDRVAALLDDPAALRTLQERSLRWWREVCSEEAVGTYMAAMLCGVGAAGAGGLAGVTAGTTQVMSHG